MPKPNERPVPYDLTAERALLASAISVPQVMAEVALVARPGDFFDQAHAIIYRALLDLWQRDGNIDLVSLRIALESLPEQPRQLILRAAGAPLDTTDPGAQIMNFLSDLWDKGLYPGAAVTMARRVAALATLRRLISVGGQIAALGYEKLGDFATLEEVLDRAERLLLEVTGDGRDDDVIGIKDALRVYMDRLGERSRNGAPLAGVTTGYADIDRLTDGVQPGDLWIPTGPTGGGKTSFLTQILLAAAAAGKRVLISSLEMTVDQLLQRLLSRQSGVDGQWLRKAQLTDDEWSAVSEAEGFLADMGIFITDRRGLSVRDVLHRGRRLKTSGGLDLVMVDYLGLLRPLDDEGNKAQELEAIAYDLKNMARELNVGVISPAQLSRDAVRNLPPSEWLSGHKNSSGIEQAADVCLSIYFPTKTPEGDEPQPGIYITKQRNGGTGMFPMTFDKATNTISPPAIRLGEQTEIYAEQEETWRR